MHHFQWSSQIQASLQLFLHKSSNVEVGTVKSITGQWWTLLCLYDFLQSQNTPAIMIIEQ